MTNPEKMYALKGICKMCGKEMIDTAEFRSQEELKQWLKKSVRAWHDHEDGSSGIIDLLGMVVVPAEKGEG